MTLISDPHARRSTLDTDVIRFPMYDEEGNMRACGVTVRALEALCGRAGLLPLSNEELFDRYRDDIEAIAKSKFDAGAITGSTLTINGGQYMV